MKEIEIFLMIDNGGNHEIGLDEDSATERYEENDTAPMRRMIKIKLTVPLPIIMTVPPIHVPEEKLTVEVK